jgi:hypothetical protein
MVNCQKKKFKWEHILFFSNSDRDFHSENNGVSQVYIYMTKNKKKVKKRYYRLCAPFCAKHWRHLCAILMSLFVICFSS